MTSFAHKAGKQDRLFGKIGLGRRLFLNTVHEKNYRKFIIESTTKRTNAVRLSQATYDEAGRPKNRRMSQTKQSLPP